LATGSLNHGIADPPSEQIAPSLFRARWLIRQNIADLDYTPARLAHDLGLSRRSLYNRFAECGITPAAFIRMVRLEQAKREIESDPRGVTALTTVALRNGFPDSSSLSHAIKATMALRRKHCATPGQNDLGVDETPDITERVSVNPRRSCLAAISTIAPTPIADDSPPAAAVH